MALMKDVLLLVPVFLLLIIVSVDSCEHEWVEFQDSCYLFGNQSVHFIGAEMFCRQHNSDLIRIDNKLENDFIKERLRERHESQWWLGMTDEESEGVWKWFNNGDTVVFTDWNPGEPEPLKDEDCAVMYHRFDYKWVDTSCTIVRPPICERSGADEIIG